MKSVIIKFAPIWVQNLAITIYNSLQYRDRRAGVYWEKRAYFTDAEKMDKECYMQEQNKRLDGFLRWVCEHSEWYKHIDPSKGLSAFPVLEKEDLLDNLDRIATIKESESIVSFTGGTTGSSMKVMYKHNDIQERHALLDHFREKFGYRLGDKVAWFSGKELSREKDLSRGICYRDDWKNKIRFFSTFHINEKNFELYWSALVDFSPEFLVGFPSSVFDICVFAKERELAFRGVVKVFFPTAETVHPMHREVIQDVLGCQVVDQYASSEGAPFILQCGSGNMHIHPLSGVFEIMDGDFNPGLEGELLVTSFSTHGTPLVRYRIGDRVKLAPDDFTCGCGSPFPVVEYIDGRSSDYIFSPENGRVNLGNISNCTKGVVGISCFQIEQEVRDEVLVKVVAQAGFDDCQENKFVSALTDRLGSEMKLVLVRVPSIPREASGKFRMVKNSL